MHSKAFKHVPKQSEIEGEVLCQAIQEPSFKQDSNTKPLHSFFKRPTRTQWDDLPPILPADEGHIPTAQLVIWVAECWTMASFIDPNDVIATSTSLALNSSWRTLMPPLRSHLFAMVPLQTHGGQSA